MRLIFKLIVVFDVLVVFAGLFFIFDKIMRNRNVEHHYVFRPFENGEKSCFGLFDDFNNCLYYAEKESEEDGVEIYKFKNGRNKLSSTHRISSLLRNNSAPNYSRRTFNFDKTDIWEYIKKHGYNLQTTIVDENLTQYKIHKNGRTIGFARKRKERGETYSLRTIDRNIEMIFILLFAIAKTDRKNKEKQIKTPDA